MDMSRKHPFWLGVLLDGLPTGMFGFEDLDLSVSVDVERSWGEAEDDGSGEGFVSQGGMGLDAERGPVMLVLQIVEDC